MSSYLSNRIQRVVLPGAKSNWNSIKAGVPQGSLLGPLLFLIFINDIVSKIQTNIRLFADDTSLYLIVDRNEQLLESTELLNKDISEISKWASDWLVTFNPNKSESLLISRKNNTHVYPPLSMNNSPILEVQNHKHLGIFLSQNCTWHTHIDYIKCKAWMKINVMRKLMYRLDRKALEITYLSFVRPLLEYGNVIWDNCTNGEKNELEKIQTEAARICSGATKLVSLNKLFTEIGWESLKSRRVKHKLILLYKMINNISPTYLSDLVPQSVAENSRYNLRNAQDLQIPFCRTTLYQNSFLPSVISEWNNLPPDTKYAPSVESFKKLLNVDKLVTPKHYYTGNRQSQILHTRLRTNCSSLNNDLFLKGIVESPHCECSQVESAHHFFFACPRYQVIRQILFNTVSQYCPLNISNLLFGDTSLSYETNVKIFEAVQKYIRDSNRF
jgi:hypothetical protein